MAHLEPYEDIIKNLRLERNLTYLQISGHLSHNYGPELPCSERSIRRFCKEHNIQKKPHVAQDALQTHVNAAVQQVRKAYYQLTYLLSLLIPSL